MSLRLGPLVLGGALALTAAIGCGGKVTVESAGSGGAATGGCDGGAVHPCLQFCGSDFYPANAVCTGGTWVCPDGTVDPSTCTTTGCAGVEPGPCMRCIDDAWVCVADDACLAQCPALACTTCPGSAASSPACGCACAGGQYVCKGISCCTTDFDCGDAVYVPCVNGVCKPPVDGGCWKDQDCNGLGCTGVFVCPCGAVCDQADQPGFCEGPKP